MKVVLDDEVDAASIYLADTSPGRTVMLRDDVIATVDDTHLLAVELLDVSQHGNIEDPEVAKRVVAWVHELLAEQASA